MNEIIQSLKANATNGKENFCYISEKQLNAMKKLSKRETKENQQLKMQISAREEVCNRLESNWNKLKEYLKSYIKLMNNNPDIIEQGQLDILYEVKDKMQELEGSDSNE